MKGVGVGEVAPLEVQVLHCLVVIQGDGAGGGRTVGPPPIVPRTPARHGLADGEGVDSPSWTSSRRLGLSWAQLRQMMPLVIEPVKGIGIG